ncbi:hypothetical protein [Amycolatopsis rifamycinica]|uniref:Uncharacterized protein n=1 Tax=Amycolatopsis rifamycinica TaxID=287986 RepID=A0A066TY14_9PSEU|nr:hypothetical protein [Amycolatopsis rifamycinica]KDN18477.1 hypothetical protein DV20_30320 [Amycolatopsis rifamycinica]
MWSGGAATAPGYVQITIQGRDHVPVTLTDIRVRVLDRRAPLHGTALNRETSRPGERKPIKFTYTVSITDPETFLIEARTPDCDCDWVADVHWSAQGRTGVLPITDGGKPFRRHQYQERASLHTRFACSP